MVSSKIIVVTVVFTLISCGFGWTKAQRNPETDYYGEFPSGPEPDHRPSRFPQGPPQEGSPRKPQGPPGRFPEERPPRPHDDVEGSGENEISERLFWSHFGGGGERVSCDYNTQAGRSCVSCNQLLTCTRSGGRLRTCRGFLRYCTDGRCTFRQSDACAAAAATTTVATTTVADSTTEA